LLIAPAAVLVDQHDPVLWALVDRLARTGRQTARIRAVIADPLQVEEERLVLRQTGALALPRLRCREPRLVVAIHQAAHARRRVRHRTGLARDTPIDVKRKRKLPLRMPLLVGIEHLAA